MGKASSARGGFKRELAAVILAEAEFATDLEVAKRHGVSNNTICNWRRRLETDPNLAKLFDIKRTEFSKKWADKASPAIQASINFLAAAAKHHLAKKNFSREEIHAVAGGLKIMAEIALTKQVLDVGNADQD